MLDEDLQEPKDDIRRNTQRSDVKSWALFRMALLFFSGVSLVHKLVVPLILKMTQLSATDYAHIDPWFVLPAVLAVWALRAKVLKNSGSVLLGMTLGYALTELYFCARGIYVKWFLFSHLLGAVPIGICAVLGLTFQSRDRSILIAWIGVVALFAGRAVETYTSTQVISAVDKANVSHREENHPIPKAVVDCGALEVDSRLFQAIATNEVVVKDCGFSPPLLSLNSSRISVRNISSRGVNIRIFLKVNGHLKAAWNTFLAPGAHKLSPELNIKSMQAGMLFSDAVASAGLTAFITNAGNAQQTQSKTWLYRRQPPAIEEAMEGLP